jgi:hypothetical protein
MKRREFLHSVSAVPLVCKIGYFTPGTGAVAPSGSLALFPNLYDQATLEFISKNLPKGPEHLQAIPRESANFNSAEQLRQFVNSSENDFILSKMHLWIRVSDKMSAFFDTLKFFSKSDLNNFLFRPVPSPLFEEAYTSMGLVSIPIAFTDGEMGRLSSLSAAALEAKIKAGESITIGTTGNQVRFSSGIHSQYVGWENFKVMKSFNEIDLFDAESISNNLHTELAKLEKTYCLLDENKFNPNYIEFVTTKKKWESMSSDAQTAVRSLASKLRPGIEAIAASQSRQRIEKAKAKGMLFESVSPALSQYLQRISQPQS